VIHRSRRLQFIGTAHGRRKKTPKKANDVNALQYNIGASVLWFGDWKGGLSFEHILHASAIISE
jgi:hypothetical protein